MKKQSHSQEGEMKKNNENIYSRTRILRLSQARVKAFTSLCEEV